MSFVERKPGNEEGWISAMKQFLRQNGNELVLTLAFGPTHNPRCPLNLKPELCIPSELRREPIDPKTPKVVVVASGKPTAGFELQLKPELSIIQDFLALAHVLAERKNSLAPRQ